MLANNNNGHAGVPPPVPPPVAPQAPPAGNNNDMSVPPPVQGEIDPNGFTFTTNQEEGQQAPQEQQRYRDRPSPGNMDDPSALSASNDNKKLSSTAGMMGGIAAACAAGEAERYR